MCCFSPSPSPYITSSGVSVYQVFRAEVEPIFPAQNSLFCSRNGHWPGTWNRTRTMYMEKGYLCRSRTLVWIDANRDEQSDTNHKKLKCCWIKCHWMSNQSIMRTRTNCFIIPCMLNPATILIRLYCIVFLFFTYCVLRPWIRHLLLSFATWTQPEKPFRRRFRKRWMPKCLRSRRACWIQPKDLWSSPRLATLSSGKNMQIWPPRMQSWKSSSILKVSSIRVWQR